MTNQPSIELSSIARTIAMIKRHEGLRLEAYEDPPGSLTYSIGYGHRDAQMGEQIDQARADALFEGDFLLVQRRTPYVLGLDAWALLDPVRQAVLYDMCYNLGPLGLAKFHRMLNDMRSILLSVNQAYSPRGVPANQWENSARDIIESRAATENPHRYAELHDMMLTGMWQQ